MALRKVRDNRRTDLEYVLINPHDFNSEFYSDFEVEQQPEIEAVNPVETAPAVETEPRTRKVKKDEVNSDG